MRKPLTLSSTGLCFLVLGVGSLLAQTPAATPDENPEGNTGALKAQVTTGGSYDAHSGNATRIVNDLHVPGALGVYGLDFTRYWNSIPNDHDNAYAQPPTDFGFSGWSHSWGWYAYEEDTSEKIDPMDDNSEEIFTTAITITFPDGHANRYKITRSNRGTYSGSVYIPGDPRCGPPYTVPEQNGFLPSAVIYDYLSDMAADGSQFWLYLADGGAVHFINGPGVYQASEVFDPHGLHTSLQYDANGRLVQVSQDGGRFLTIHWNSYGSLGMAIDWVQSGGPAGAQTVYYNYADTSGWLTLSTVNYPEGAQTVYTYQNCYEDYPCSADDSPTPLLKVADDKHYAGAMTKISYVYRGTACQIQDQPTIQPYPLAKLDYYLAPANAIATEKSADTGVGVSSFWIGCFTGTRMEDNGLGGRRVFNFGRSTRSTDVDSLGYQLVRLTDFTNQPSPANLPFVRQHGGNTPTDVWDGRNIRTHFVYAGYNSTTGQPGDSSGQPSEIHHVTADGSYQVFDRVNPGGSDAQDFSRVPNRFNRWLFSHTDERGFTTAYTRDSRLRVRRIDYPDGSYELFTYDNNGFNKVTYHMLASGAEQFFGYDGYGRLQLEYNSVDGWDGRKEYTYDSLDRVATVSDGRSRNAGAPYSTWTEYNGRHQATKVHYAPTNGGDPAITYEYDAYGNCTAITDEMGHRGTYTYDSYRRCTSYTEPLDSQNSRRWDWLYDRWIIDGVGWRDQSTHTKNEWRIQIGPAFNYLGDRPMTARAHDLQNRIIIEQTGWIQPAGAIGNWYPSGDLETHYFGYDENGQKKTYIDPLNRTTTYDYDLRNRLWKTNEPMGRTTETLYDVTNNKTLVKFPVEASGQRTQQWLYYDAFGQPRQFVDERNNVTDFNYWPWGPMKKLAEVITHRDQDGGGTEDQDTRFYNDLMGRPQTTVFPDGSFEYTHYDLAGQVDLWENRKRQIKRISYDARGRENYHTWDGDAAPRIDRSWDDASRMTSISNPFSTIDYGYDSAGQPLYEGNTIAGSGGRVQTNFSRYPNGDVAHLVYPDGFPLRKDYTARGQMKTVGMDDGSGNWIAQFVNYTYLADGKVDHQDYPHNGTSTAFGYDGRGFISSVLHQRIATGQPLSSRTYARDNRDRISSWVKGTDASINPMENGRGNRYVYDAEGQLTDAYYGALDPGGNVNNWVREDHFDYDALGNRRNWDYLGSRSQWMNFTRKDNGLNQYRAWWNYSIINYDDDIGGTWGSPGAANGVIMQDGNITAGYNALNQPMLATSNALSPNWMFFGYDPLGRCVKRWTGALVDGWVPPADSNPATYYYYDGWSLIQEGPSAGTPDRIYVHGAQLDQILCSYQYSTGMALDFYYDAIGHCTLTIDDYSRNIWEQYDYDAFGQPYFYDGSGNPRPNGSTLGTRFLFTGREWIADLKLYDYRNRMYQPELGRFLQPDPKEFGAGDYNLYRYCHNDPVNNSDPFGFDFTGAGEAREVHDLRDPDGLVVNGLTGPYDISVLVAVVPGANGTFSLQVARYDVTVEAKRVAQTANGVVRSRHAIDASKKHEDLHEAHARADHDANQHKVLKTGLNQNQANAERRKEEHKLIDRFRMNREQDQRDCKKGEGEWKHIILEENKR